VPGPERGTGKAIHKKQKVTRQKGGKDIPEIYDEIPQHHSKKRRGSHGKGQYLGSHIFGKGAGREIQRELRPQAPGKKRNRWGNRKKRQNLHAGNSISPSKKKPSLANQREEKANNILPTRGRKALSVDATHQKGSAVC